MKKHQATWAFAAFFPAVSLIAITIFNTACHKDMAPTGDPKISHTDLSPDSVILPLVTDTFKLDLNSDGIADFEFDRDEVETCSDALLGTTARAAKISVRPARPDCSVLISGSSALLDSGVVISPDSVWTTSVDLLNARTSANGHCVTTPSVLNGDLLNNTDRYIGLRFTDGGKTYYGWAKLLSSYTLSPSPNAHLNPGSKLILKDYAFNGNANQGLKAGQIK